MPIAENLSLTNQFEIVNAATNFNRLISLDQVWTNYLEQAEPPLPEKDISELETIVENMIQLLEESRRGAEYLTVITYNFQDELAEEFQKSFQEAELGEEAKSILLKTIERHGGIVEFSEQSIQGIMRNSDSEIEMLQAKISKIKNGEFIPGDLSRKFICDLVGGIILGSLAAPFPSNLVILGASAGILIAMEIKGDGC